MSAASSSSSGPSTTLKIYFSLPSGKQEIRRLTTASPLVLAAVNAFLTATYERHFTPPLAFVLQFDDGEDLCSISSEAELQDALALHAASAQAGQAMKLLAAFDTQPLHQSVEPVSVPATPSQLQREASSVSLAPPSRVVAEEPHPPSEDGELVGDSDGEYERIDDDKPAPAVSEPKEVVAPKASPPPPPSVTIEDELPVSSTPLVEDPVPVASPVEIVDVTNASAPTPTPEQQAEASPDSSSPAIHSGVRCDACNVYPIVGTRFNCVTCGPADGGYDLCARCEASGTHGHAKQHEFAVHVAPVGESESASASASSCAAPESEQASPARAVQAAVQRAVESFAQAVQSNAQPGTGSPLESLKSSVADVVTAFQQVNQQHREQRRAARQAWWEARRAEQQQQQEQQQTAGASASASGPVVHPNITCDGCGQSPLTGVRYRCMQCAVPGGFDLCAGCEERGFSNAQHDAATHTMLKMRTPQQQQHPHPAGRGPWGRHGGRGGMGPHHAPHGHGPFGHGPRGPFGHGPFGGPGPHGPFGHGGPRGPFGHHGPHGPHGQGPFGLGGLPDFFSGLFGAFSPFGGRGGHGGCRRGEGPWGRHHDPNRPRAEFVSDVTLADGLEVHAGETLRKVWSIKNVGPVPWPAGTKLVFVGGDLAPESEGLGGSGDASGAVVPYAGPGDVVHVAMDIVVPQEAGRFRATFRLQAPDGDRFGPRVWIDVRVPPAAATDSEATKAEASKAEASKTAAAAPEPTPAAPAAAAASAKPSAPQPTEEERLAAELAAEFRAAHMSPQQAQQQAQQQQQAGVGAAPSPSAPVAGARPAFPYMSELGYLRSMGFVDNALNKYLLLNNRGDLQACVQWLLANAK